MKGTKLFKSFLCLCLAIGLPVILAGCPTVAKKAEPVGKAYYTFFDTVSFLYSYAGDSQEIFDENTEAAAGLLEEYHRLFDIYHEYAGINNLCTINKQAGGEALEVDQKLIEFLLYTKELYTLTNGEMNVMFGAVLRPWHDCRAAAEKDPQKASLPNPALLEQAKQHTDISLLEIDEEKSTVRISDPEAQIDVGAIGKGYATEKAAGLLSERNAEGYVLNVGGNIRIIGKKPDQSGWVTGIKDPFDHENNYAMYVELSDTSCVTSGIYERFFTVDGTRYHHIIDKDTLMPADHFASVSVITKDSGLADALSTALFCMSYEDGRALVDSLENVDVLWIFQDGAQEYTPGIHPIDKKPE